MTIRLARRERGSRAVRPLVWAGSILLLGVLCLLSLAIGSRDIAPADVVTALLHPAGTGGGTADAASIIVWQLRVPRTVLAILVGAALAVAGVVMQALTRNPLAEPGLLGVNSGAALSVVVAISVFGLTRFDQYVWFAFAGSAAAAVAVYLLGANGVGRVAHTQLLLAGVALSASLGAVTGLITLFDSTTFDSYRVWTVGSLAGRDPGTVLMLWPALAVGIGLALVLGPQLNAFALGDDTGRALGLRVTLVRAAGFVCVTLLCGAATAAAGPIAFVGLVVPHAVRMLLGSDQRRVLAASLVAGPLLVLASDILGRVLARPGEVEAGIVTAFLGAPVLLWLVLRGRGTGAR